MMHFTLEESKPSEATIFLIKQIAYSYRSVRLPNGRCQAMSMN